MKDLNQYPPLCDILRLDFYPNYNASPPLNADVFDDTQKFADENGKPVIISETGHPGGPRLLGYTGEKQAPYVRMALEKAFSLDVINGLGILRYRDSSWRPPREPLRPQGKRRKSEASLGCSERGSLKAPLSARPRAPVYNRVDDMWHPRFNPTRVSRVHFEYPFRGGSCRIASTDRTFSRVEMRRNDDRNWQTSN